MSSHIETHIFGFKIPIFIDKYNKYEKAIVKGTITQDDLNYDFKYCIYEYYYGKLENIFFIDIWNNRELIKIDNHYDTKNDYLYRKNIILPDILKNNKLNKTTDALLIDIKHNKTKLYIIFLNKKFNGYIATKKNIFFNFNKIELR